MAEDKAPAKNGESKVAANEKAIPVPKKLGIEVVAKKNGFFKHTRYAPGDVFFVDNEQQLGSWMECTDKELQKKHLEAMKAKKAAAKAKAGK